MASAGQAQLECHQIGQNWRNLRRTESKVLKYLMMPETKGSGFKCDNLHVIDVGHLLQMGLLNQEKEPIHGVDGSQA